ncbi:MAG: hypothetical protein ACI9UA_004759 [Pseudoalteromonas tetraodonis]|jgi:hypothetical protein
MISKALLPAHLAVLRVRELQRQHHPEELAHHDGSFPQERIRVPRYWQDDFMGGGFIRPHTPLSVPQKYFDRFSLDSI